LVLLLVSLANALAFPNFCRQNRLVTAAGKEKSVIHIIPLLRHDWQRKTARFPTRTAASLYQNEFSIIFLCWIISGAPSLREHAQFLPKTHKALLRKALWAVFSFERYYNLDVAREDSIDVFRAVRSRKQIHGIFSFEVLGNIST